MGWNEKKLEEKKKKRRQPLSCIMPSNLLPFVGGNVEKRWWIIYLSAAVVAMRGVEGADGQALVRTLAVENTVAAGADRPQRFRRKSLQSGLGALRLHDHRPLPVVPGTSLITARAQPRAHYVVRRPRPSSWQAPRYGRVLVLERVKRLVVELSHFEPRTSRRERNWGNLKRLLKGKCLAAKFFNFQ